MFYKIIAMLGIFIKVAHAVDEDTLINNLSESINSFMHNKTEKTKADLTRDALLLSLKFTKSDLTLDEKIEVCNDAEATTEILDQFKSWKK